MRTLALLLFACLPALACASSRTLDDGDGGASEGPHAEGGPPDAARDAGRASPITVRVEANGSARRDAWVMFQGNDGALVDVQRTDETGLAASALDEGMVTVHLGGSWPPRFYVQTDLRAGDDVDFDLSDEFGLRAVLVMLHIPDALPGATRYELLGEAVEPGSIVEHRGRLSRDGTLAIVLRAIDESDRVIAYGWFIGAVTEGAEVVPSPWSTDVVALEATFEGHDPDRITFGSLGIETGGSWRAVSRGRLDLGDTPPFEVPIPLRDRRLSLFAQTQDVHGARTWRSIGALGPGPVTVRFGPSEHCPRVRADVSDARPSITLTSGGGGDRTDVELIANAGARGRLRGHRSLWMITTRPAATVTVRVPELAPELSALQVRPADLIALAHTWDQEDVASYDAVRLRPGDFTPPAFGPLRDGAPDGTSVGCFDSVTVLLPDRDEDGLPDSDDPCPDDRDDEC